MLDIPRGCDRLGVYSGLIYQPVFLAMVMVSIAVNPWFNLSKDALSDLGSSQANYPWIFNLSLIVSGAIGLVFSQRVLLKLNSPLNHLGIVMIAATLLFIAVGIFPEDAPVYVYSSMTIHKFFTLLGFLLGSLVVVAYEVYWTIKRDWRHIGVPLLLFSLLVPTAYFLNREYVSLALIELAFGFAILMWSYSTVYYYMRMRGADAPAQG